MAATVSGSKTVTRDYAPHLTGSGLTTLLGTAIENLTVDEYKKIWDAIKRVGKARDGSVTIGSLLS